MWVCQLYLLSLLFLFRQEFQQLNLSGATKLSTWFARILAEVHALPDHRTDAAVAAEWNHRLKAYDEYLNMTEVEK